MQYEIKGGNLPVVICSLDNGESVFNESGAMCWMSPNMEMTTSGGGIGKMFGRMFSGENLFQNIYTARNDSGMIAFASSFPGSIRPVEIRPGDGLVVQKSGFCWPLKPVWSFPPFSRKRAGAGFFGGEGFYYAECCPAAVRLSLKLTAQRLNMTWLPDRR